MKKVLFVCGTGGITSAIVEREVLTACQAAGISVQTSRCNPTEVYGRAQDVDFIVTTTALGSNFPVPVINALSIVTNVGKEKTLEEIIELLKI